MRTPWIAASEALRERLVKPAQLDSAQPESEMPPYMESLLSHLRLLVGVPFDYLIPDERLLPDESIRFFYLDRSWTDRLVDGTVAVGKIGTREQSHHQAHSPAVRQQLDISEHIVRSLQRRLGSFTDLKASNDASAGAADTITGLLLRSQAVSSWPHMDVRAYSRDIQEPLEPTDPDVQSLQLKTLRLELLSPGVLIALFQGVPQLVLLEEPHHGVQFGVHINGTTAVYLRDPAGSQVRQGGNPINIPLPVRAANSRVVHVAELRKRLFAAQSTHPTAITQAGSASFAISVLNPPWRQRFEGSVDHAGTQSTHGGFVSNLNFAQRVQATSTVQAFKDLLSPHGNP
jgi:hypothetical protein